MKQLVRRREPFELTTRTRSSAAASTNSDDDDYNDRHAMLFHDDGDDDGGGDGDDENVLVIATTVPQQRRRFILAVVCLLGLVVSLVLVGLLGDDNNHPETLSNTSQDTTTTHTVDATTNQTPTMSPYIATVDPTTIQLSTTLPTNSPSQLPTSTVKYYSVARTDRAGSAIKEMYLAHAHAYATNTTYGGACVDAIDWEPLIKKHGEKFKDNVYQRVQERKELIQLLGLQKELPIACPTEQDIKEGKAVVWTNRNKFKNPGFTAEWMDYIQTKTLFPYAPLSATTVQIVVHLRRGDFTPCHVPDRYLPNIYFSRLLDSYLPRYCSDPIIACNITIFTEADAYEPLDEFQQRKFTTVDVTTAPPTIWKDIINAHVFVMSASAFSFIPAILNRNGNIITPYSDIPHWETVENSIWAEAYHKREEQIKECSP